MMITSRVSMELLAPAEPAVISGVQEDRYTRQLEMTLTRSGESWPVPEDVTVLVRYSRPDGSGGQYDTLPNGAQAWSAQNNVLTVALAPQVLAVPGAVNLWVSLIRQEVQLSTFAVVLHVAPKAGDDVQSTEVYANVTGFLPGTTRAAVGQLLQVAAVRADGYVTALVPITLRNLAVMLEQQVLTQEQQAQVRDNIGAATVEEVLAALPTWEGGRY